MDGGSFDQTRHNVSNVVLGLGQTFADFFIKRHLRLVLFAIYTSPTSGPLQPSPPVFVALPPEAARVSVPPFAAGNIRWPSSGRWRC